MNFCNELRCVGDFVEADLPGVTMDLGLIWEGDFCDNDCVPWGILFGARSSESVP